MGCVGGGKMQEACPYFERAHYFSRPQRERLWQRAARAWKNFTTSAPTWSVANASRTLGGGSLATLRRVILPLLRPAVVAALVYSFVRAMTTVSAVVFLVTAEYDMATTYIINRVLNGDYGVAIAYSSVLILLMLAAIGIIQLLVGHRQLLVGQRRIGRRHVTPPPPVVTGREA